MARTEYLTTSSLYSLRNWIATAMKMLKSLFITAPVILVETADTCYTYKKWESKMKLLTKELS